MEQLNVLAYAVPTEVPRRRFRPLPPLERPESRPARLGMAVVAVVLAVAFFWFVMQYWAPAHPGVDQSGYLMGGKQLAATGSTGLKPNHPLGFVSAMYVRNDATGYNYPKYPVGLPLLYAIAIWTCGTAGPKAAHLVSPIGMAMAVLGTYFLARRFAGTFASLAGMIVLATSPVVLLLADNPNSHASCLAFCIWGAFFLVRFWETGSVWRGLLGGLFLGFAVTIRYPEGVFGAMVGLVVLSGLPWERWRELRGNRLIVLAIFAQFFVFTAVNAYFMKRYGFEDTPHKAVIGFGLAGIAAFLILNYRTLAPLLGWLLPVVALVVFNRIAMGTWTGYDTTNESAPGKAFTVDNFFDNWELFTRKLHDTGLFFALPLGVLGMVLAMRSSLRRGLLLWLWLIPGAAVYLSYYWAPENGLSYLRFLITLLPPLAVGVAVTLDTAMTSTSGRLSRVMTPIAVGVVVLVASSMGVYRGLLRLDIDDRQPISMESQLRQELNLSGLADVVIQTAPKGSVLIAPSAPLHALQFLGDYECFDAEVFRGAYAARLKGEAERNESNPDDPNPIQPQRRNFLLSQIKDKNDDQLAVVQNEIIKAAIDGGRRAYVLTTNYNDVQILAKRYGTRIKPANGIESFIAQKYSELSPPKKDDTPPPPDVNNRNGQGRRGPNGGGPNNGPPGGRPNRPFRAGARPNNANWLDSLPAQKWLLVEIRKHVPKETVKPVPVVATQTPAAGKPSTPAAAPAKPKPTTAPATKPATTRPVNLTPAKVAPATTRPTTRATTRAAGLVPSPVVLNGRGLG